MLCPYRAGFNVSVRMFQKVLLNKMFLKQMSCHGESWLNALNKIKLTPRRSVIFLCAYIETLSDEILFNNLFRRTGKEISTLYITGYLWGKSIGN